MVSSSLYLLRLTGLIDLYKSTIPGILKLGRWQIIGVFSDANVYFVLLKRKQRLFWAAVLPSRAERY